MTHTINEVLLNKGIPQIPSLAALYEGKDTYHCGLPEFDPYGPREGCIYIGPVGGFKEAAKPVWADREGKKLLAYLPAKHPQLNNLIKVCRAHKLKLLIYAPGYIGQSHVRAVDVTVKISPNPIDFAQALKEVDLVISAGTTTLSQALIQGRPVLAFPTQLEQRWFAYQAKKMGVGDSVSPRTAPPTLEKQLLAALTNTDLAKNARTYANKQQYPDQKTTVIQIAEACERLFHAGV